MAALRMRHRSQKHESHYLLSILFQLGEISWIYLEKMVHKVEEGVGAILDEQYAKKRPGITNGGIGHRVHVVNFLHLFLRCGLRGVHGCGHVYLIS